MRVCVLGAGAIGGWMGVKLAQAGHAVSVLARGATLAAIRAEGLRLIEAGETAAVKVAASDKPGDLTADAFPDLLIVAVKSQGLRDAALAAKPLIGPNTVVLTAMNGVPWWFFQRSDRPLAGTALASIDPTGEIAASIPSANVADIAKATNYVKAGLSEALAGKPLTAASTRPYGCSIKYKS